MDEHFEAKNKQYLSVTQGRMNSICRARYRTYDEFTAQKSKKSKTDKVEENIKEKYHLISDHSDVRYIHSKDVVDLDQYFHSDHRCFMCRGDF